MNLNDEQKEVIACQNHLLVIGGPGSGKTTTSILKAAHLLEHELEPYQRVLFLSFARASVSRVVEAVEHEHDFSPAIKRRIDVDTYHSFFWRILKTHGYLIGLPSKIEVLSPQRLAVAMATIRSEYPPSKDMSEEQKNEKESREAEEVRRLMYDEGLISFDFFAEGVGILTQKSMKVRALIATRYPVIIFDEFQDTNQSQWNAVKGLGIASTMVALADPEQRIYDWIGADPERLNHFKDEFKPDEINFGQSNYRSPGTDIAQFANESLTGNFVKESYTGISLKAYEPNENQAYTELVSRVIQSIKRAKVNNPHAWSVAILVPTKKLTRRISAVLDSPPKPLPSIYHHPYIEVEAAILAAEIIAFLMQPQHGGESESRFIELVSDYFKGRGGDTPTKKDVGTAISYQKAIVELRKCEAKGRPLRNNSILIKTLETYEAVKRLSFVGNPEEDWKQIARLLQVSGCKRLNLVAEDAKNLRLLRRGDKIRQEMTSQWRASGSYDAALDAIRKEFVQQYFASKADLERGVLVMNMHKAKGKQFDEVIIFEDWPKRSKGKIMSNTGRIVRFNDSSHIDEPCKQNFRVSITRARYRTTILTPKGDICRLLRRRS